jgi:DNA-binding XRE family transcriptional regulator
MGLDGPSPLPAQSRMARAALQWSLHEAARAAGVSYRTILRFEKEQRETGNRRDGGDWRTVTSIPFN